MKAIPLSLVFLLFLTLQSVGQNALSSNSGAYNSQRELPIEKVYVSLEKEIFEIRDTIDYSAFTFYSTGQKDHIRSKYLNINLVSSNGKLVESQKLILEDGVAFGRLKIPNDIQEGEYLLVAYTDLMQGEIGKYFYKGIRVSNGVYTSLTEDKEVILKAIPEGERLIKNLPNNLIIQSISSHGEGIPISGKVLNSELNEIGDFTTNAEGYGQILFQPLDTETYFLKAQGAELSKIPIIEEHGMNLRLVNLPKNQKISFGIQSSPGVLEDSIRLLIYSEEYPLIDQKIILNQDKLSMSIPYKLLDKGLHRMVVLDDRNEKLLSRHFFIESEIDEIGIVEVNNNIQDSIEIALKSTEEINFQLGRYTFPLDQNIGLNTEFISYAALGPLLNQRHSKLDRFFNPFNSERLASLDLFLSSLDYSHLEEDEKRLRSSQYDSSFHFKILLTDLETKTPLFKERILIFSEALPGYKKAVKTDENGLLTLDGLYFVGDKDFFFQKAYDSHQDFKVELIRSNESAVHYPIPKDIHYPQLESLKKSEAKAPIVKDFNLEDFTDLEEFTIESERIRTEQKYRYRPESMLGLGKRIKVKEEDVRHPNPLKLVESYGVQLMPIPQGYSAKIKGNTPAILWDGIRLHQPVMINYYSAYSVAEFDVYYGGVISFYSKSIEETLTTKFNSIKLQGFANSDPHSGITMTNFKVGRTAISDFKIKNVPNTIFFYGISKEGDYYWDTYEVRPDGVEIKK